VRTEEGERRRDLGGKLGNGLWAGYGSDLVYLGLTIRSCMAGLRFYESNKTTSGPIIPSCQNVSLKYA
jgi:hypothetical protein